MGDAERVYINALITLLHNHDVDLTEELEIDLQNFVRTMIEEVSILPTIAPFNRDF